jgi:hypothetical protein
MTTESPLDTAELEERLGALHTEIAPPADVWPRIEAKLRDARSSAIWSSLPAEIEPPRDLWPDIRATLARPAGRARFAPRPSQFAAALGSLTLLAIAGLTALRLSVLTEALPARPSLAALDAADDWWVAQFERAAAVEPAPAAASLTSALSVIRDDYEMTRRQRRMIEAQLGDDLANPNLQAVWRHTYAAELALTSEAERILSNY